MTRLAITSMLIGVGLVATRSPGVIAPTKFREWAVKFPRSVLWGRVLMGIAAAIAWVVVYHAASDEWVKFRPLIVVGFPVAYWLVVRYGTNYLAVRGLAALLLMVAKVMVDATDISDSPVRLFVTTLAYLWVVAAIWMTIAPHHLRDLIGWATENDQRCRRACGAGLALGIVLVLLGGFVY